MLKPAVLFEALSGTLTGKAVQQSSRVLADLGGVFLDEEARASLPQEELVYEVQMHDACGEVEGGLFFGVSHIYPGKVGDEYYMTKGHYHEKRDRGEYYWGIAGTGLLVLMDESRKSWAEQVHPGSLHYIPGRVAHRLVNTGDVKLVVGACWPSDAGHDYASILKDGFSVRVHEQDGQPVLVEQPSSNATSKGVK